MKKSLLILTFLTIFMSFNLQARGGGFGSSFGGSLVGSMVGSSFGSAMSRPREVIYQQPPVIYSDAPSSRYERDAYIDRLERKIERLEEKIDEQNTK